MPYHSSLFLQGRTGVETHGEDTLPPSVVLARQVSMAILKRQFVLSTPRLGWPAALGIVGPHRQGLNRMLYIFRDPRIVARLFPSLAFDQLSGPSSPFSI